MWSALSLSLSQINKPKSKFIKRRLKKKTKKKNENENSSDVLYFRRFLATKSPRSFSSPRLLSPPELCPSEESTFLPRSSFCCVVDVVASLLFPRKGVLISDGRLTKNFFFFNFFSQKHNHFFSVEKSLFQNPSLARALAPHALAFFLSSSSLLLSINDRLLDEFIIIVARFFLERKVYFFKNDVNWLQILLQNISSVNSLQKHYKNGKL